MFQQFFCSLLVGEAFDVNPLALEQSRDEHLDKEADEWDAAVSWIDWVSCLDSVLAHD